MHLGPVEDLNAVYLMCPSSLCDSKNSHVGPDTCYCQNCHQQIELPVTASKEAFYERTSEREVTTV